MHCVSLLFHFAYTVLYLGLVRIYIGHHFVYLVFVYIMSPMHNK